MEKINKVDETVVYSSNGATFCKELSPTQIAVNKLIDLAYELEERINNYLEMKDSKGDLKW